MISPSTAALAISIAKGVIKLGGRIDRLMSEKTVSSVISPDCEYLRKLGRFYPSLNLDSTETRLSAFYIRAGKDDRTVGYAGRVALLVVDVLAEFGVEHAFLFQRDKPTQAAS